MMIVNAILTLAALLGLWWLYFYAWRPYRTDRTRQQLFRLRDELFEYWDDHDLPFDHEAYRLMRDMLNGMIRFTHKIDLLRIAAMIYADQKFGSGQKGGRFEKRLEAALKSLPSHARRKLEHTRMEMHLIVLEHLVFHSILWTTLYWLVRLLHLTRRLTGMVLADKARWSSLDAQVIKTRMA